MRLDKRFCARMAVAAGLVASAVSVFGLSPVHAQTKPTMPPASQQGTIVRRMNIDDAVATALEQNLDLQVQRINPQLRDLDIAQFKANYTPNATSSLNMVDQTQPPSSLLSGNTSQLTTGRSTYDFGITSRYRGFRVEYQVLWSNGRTTTNNIFTQFDPQLTSNISATYTQPLLRNSRSMAYGSSCSSARRTARSPTRSCSSRSPTPCAACGTRTHPMRDRQPQRAAPVARARAGSPRTIAPASRSAPWRRSISCRRKPKWRRAKKR